MQIKKKIINNKTEYYNNIPLERDNKLMAPNIQHNGVEIKNNLEVQSNIANENNARIKNNSNCKTQVHNLVFSSSKIDLTKVEFLEGATDIILNVVFGSVKIIVPQDVTIVAETSNIFSDFKIVHDKDSKQNPNKVLKIYAKSIFSSVYIYKK